MTAPERDNQTMVEVMTSLTAVLKMGNERIKGTDSPFLANIILLERLILVMEVALASAQAQASEANKLLTVQFETEINFTKARLGKLMKELEETQLQKRTQTLSLGCGPGAPCQSGKSLQKDPEGK